jgi:hypothetical protein
VKTSNLRKEKMQGGRKVDKVQKGREPNEMRDKTGQERNKNKINK